MNDARRKLQSMGVELSWAENGKRLATLEGRQFGDHTLRLVAAIRDVAGLGLRDTAITPQGVDAFLRKARLGFVAIQDHPVAVAAAFLQCPTLKEMRMEGMQIGDALVRAMPRMPLLREAYLSKNPITGTGFADPKRFPALDELWLNECPITRAGLQAICSIRRLRHLLLWGTPLCDDDLSALEGHPSLEYLGLKDTGVTDRGLPSIATIAHLRDVDLRGTAVTNQGLPVLSSLQGLEDIGLPEQTEETEETVRVLATFPRLTTGSIPSRFRKWFLELREKNRNADH